MNRKATREQNDISRIIENLPLRLQRKIAEEVLAAGGNGAADQFVTQPHASALVGREQSQTSILEANDSLCTSVNGTASPVLESSGCVSVSQAPDEAAVPGILRVNLQTAGGAVEGCGSPVRNKREKGRDALRAQPMREYCAGIRGVVTRDVSPMSPVRLPSKSMEYPAWFEMLDTDVAKELKQQQDTLASLMQHSSLLENWSSFCETRANLQQIFSQLLTHNLKFCIEQKIDTFFWKALCYHVRKQLEAQRSAQATECALALLKDAMEFYTALHKRLCEKYLAPAVEALSLSEQRRRIVIKLEFIAKVAAQKLLICLGDLYRYQTRLLQSCDYSEAVRFYQQAQSLIPTNGIPYNQLAIVALSARKKFDAVYFHMRSLMSSNAIYSARESLLVLFDEIRKKYEETELKISPQHHPYHHNQLTKGTTSKSLRREVWIYPDSVRRLHRTETNSSKQATNEERRLKDLAPEEIQRRFTSLYLYVIGKLYTGIGMESIQEHQRKLLVQLCVLLKRQYPLFLTRSRLLKIVALNIFVLEHNMRKESRREIRYHAFNFCNQVFGLVLRKCNQLFTEHLGIENQHDDKCFYDLNTLLQFIKVYCDWLALNVLIWEPIRSEEHIFIYCWAELQRLFSHIQRSAKALEQAGTTPTAVLFEDIYLIGFTPLAAAPNVTTDAAGDAGDADASEVNQFRVRVAAIDNFQQCYEEHKQLLDISLNPIFMLEELNSQLNGWHFEDADEQDGAEENEDIDNNEIEDENTVANGEGHKAMNVHLKVDMTLPTTAKNSAENAQISQLLKLKNELAAKTKVKRIYNNKLEEILKFVDSKLYIEVRPRYLLPDTNCFIDCLEEFELLAKQFRRYTLIVPLTVVKELDGLSKGVKLETNGKTYQKQRIHHFDDVSTRAKKSLDFIKTAKRVKCATTKGSIINASLFALVEEEYVSNDDKILATALALSKTMSSETSKDGKCLIQTELVLITTDRNLRVKALSRNMAVSGVTEFLQWATDCNT